jgi:hypothetical protein
VILNPAHLYYMAEGMKTCFAEKQSHRIKTRRSSMERRVCFQDTNRD